MANVPKDVVVEVRSEISDIHAELNHVNQLISVLHGQAVSSLNEQIDYFLSIFGSEYYNRVSFTSRPLTILPSSNAEGVFIKSGSLHQPLMSLGRVFERILQILNYIHQVISVCISETNGIGVIDVRIRNEINAIWVQKPVRKIASLISTERRLVSDSAKIVRSLKFNLSRLKSDLELAISKFQELISYTNKCVDDFVNIRNSQYSNNLMYGHNYRTGPPFPVQTAEVVVKQMNSFYDEAINHIFAKMRSFNGFSTLKGEISLAQDEVTQLRNLLLKLLDLAENSR